MNLSTLQKKYEKLLNEISNTSLPYFSDLQTLLTNQLIIIAQINGFKKHTSELNTETTSDVLQDSKKLYTSFQQTTQAIDKIKSTVIKTASHILISFIFITFFFFLRIFKKTKQKLIPITK